MTDFADLTAFVRTAELAAFSAVSDEIGMTASGVSRSVGRLEKRLGTALLHRSTRRLTLTQEGEAYLVHARQILRMVEAAEAEIVGCSGTLQGRVRINTGTAFARYKLVPSLPAFQTLHPLVAVQLTVTDRRIDPIAEQVDVTVRVGPLSDSELIAIRLGEVRRVIAASPDYISDRGAPKLPSDLGSHNCLTLSGFSRLDRWPFFECGRKRMIPVNGNFRSDNAESLLEMGIAGAGIIRVGDFLGQQALADGRLVPLLSGVHDDDPQPITALILPDRRHVPRVAALVEFLKQTAKSGAI
ncbi:MAG: LysR family transcriptional regulator [Pseudomonadota bacterium]